MRFSYGRDVIESSRPLPELPAAASRARWSVSFAAGARQRLAHGAWHTRWRMQGGRAWLSIAEKGAGHFLRFHGLADFLIGSDLCHIQCHPRPGVTPATQRHLLLDQVLPLLIGAQGKLVLHASAAAVSFSGMREKNGVGVAFVGKSGQGKSTLCASLLQAGAALICDDSLILERRGSAIQAIPSYPGVRLWPDMVALLRGKRSPVAHYSSKQRIARRTPLRNRVPLRALYLLETRGRSGNVSAARLSPRVALERLLPHCFRMLPNDCAYMRREFMAIGTLVQAVPVYQLEYPRRLSALRRVRELIASHLETTGAMRV